MLKRMSLLLSSSVLVLAALPLGAAQAAAPMGFVGAVGAGYGQSSCDGCDNTDAWTIGGSGAFGLGPTFGAQIDASYASVEDVDGFGIGGSLFWAPAMGRAGVTLQWATADESGIDLNTLGYGVFGEFFASDYFTIAAKGGGFSVNADGFGASESETGYYVGGALTGYAMPNLAIQGDILFGGADDLFGSGQSIEATNIGIGAEFLVSEMVPIAIFGGYSWTNVQYAGADADGNTWLVGVRFYFGPTGPTLVQKHRNGSLGWAGSTNVNGIIAP